MISNPLPSPRFCLALACPPFFKIDLGADRLDLEGFEAWLDGAVRADRARQGWAAGAQARAKLTQKAAKDAVKEAKRLKKRDAALAKQAALQKAREEAAERAKALVKEKKKPPIEGKVAVNGEDEDLVVEEEGFEEADALWALDLGDEPLTPIESLDGDSSFVAALSRAGSVGSIDSNDSAGSVQGDDVPQVQALVGGEAAESPRDSVHSEESLSDEDDEDGLNDFWWLPPRERVKKLEKLRQEEADRRASSWANFAAESFVSFTQVAPEKANPTTAAATTTPSLNTESPCE